MKNFIEIHHEGSPVLLAVSHIAEIVSDDGAGEDSVTIYLDVYTNAGSQQAWLADESYSEIVRKIKNAI